MYLCVCCVLCVVCIPSVVSYYSLQLLISALFLFLIDVVMCLFVSMCVEIPAAKTNIHAASWLI